MKTASHAGAMLGIVRDFALEALQRSNEEQVIRAQHAQAYLRLCRQAENNLYAFNTVQAVWMNRLTVELDNIREALSWALESAPVLALELASVLSRFWYLRGEQNEGYSWLGSALEKFSTTSLQDQDSLYLQAWAKFEIGYMATYVDVPNATQHLESSLAIYRHLEDPAGTGMCLSELAIQKWYRSKLREADALMQQAIPMLEESGNYRRLGSAYSNAIEIKKSLGHLAGSREVYRVIDFHQYSYR